LAGRLHTPPDAVALSMSLIAVPLPRSCHCGQVGVADTGVVHVEAVPSSAFERST
jgi:hypothetical protein